MSETRIVFNSDGFRQILQSEGCKEVVQQVTDNIRDKAVANYDAVTLDNVDASAGISSNVKQMPTRWVGFVSTSDKYAAMAEAYDSILTRALS